MPAGGNNRNQFASLSGRHADMMGWREEKQCSFIVPWAVQPRVGGRHIIRRMAGRQRGSGDKVLCGPVQRVLTRSTFNLQ